MSPFNITIRASGANQNGVWVVPRSLPIGVVTQTAGLRDLSDFASLVDETGKPVMAAPAANSQLEVLDVRVRRFHRREEGAGEGADAHYSAEPSFAYEFVVVG